MVNPVHTNIEMSIKNLSVTFLPSDLLRLLIQARTAYAQGNIQRTQVFINIIKRSCKQRGIYMSYHGTAPKIINYRERNLYRGRFIDIKI